MSEAICGTERAIPGYRFAHPGYACYRIETGFVRQGMKAYLVLDLSVKDFGRFRKYIAEIPAFITRNSGKYIVQGTQPTTIEGDWKPERMVIIEFPARDNAEAFLSDP